MIYKTRRKLFFGGGGGARSFFFDGGLICFWLTRKKKGADEPFGVVPRLYVISERQLVVNADVRRTRAQAYGRARRSDDRIKARARSLGLPRADAPLETLPKLLRIRAAQLGPIVLRKRPK